MKTEIGRIECHTILLQGCYNKEVSLSGKVRELVFENKISVISDVCATWCASFIFSLIIVDYHEHLSYCPRYIDTLDGVM